MSIVISEVWDLSGLKIFSSCFIFQIYCTEYFVMGNIIST